MRLWVSIEPGKYARNTRHVSWPSCQASVSSTCTPSIGKQEGSSEIRPYCFAVEIGSIECVPRGTHLVTRERVFRRTALSNRCAIELLNGYTIWREHGALIGSPIWHDRRAFLAQPNSHAARG